MELAIVAGETTVREIDPGSSRSPLPGEKWSWLPI